MQPLSSGETPDSNRGTTMFRQVRFTKLGRESPANIEHATVEVVVVGEAEFGEDLQDVALDGALGDDEAARDAAARAAS